MASDIYSALAASQTPQNLYFRRMLEEGTNSSPIQHWSQGASRMAHALLAGMAMRNNQGDDEVKKFDMIFGPGSSAPASTAAPAAPPSPIAGALAGPSGAPRIYDQNERNPLDPPSGNDRDLLIRAIHAEAGNQGPEGQRAVASVIRNRAVNGGYGGDTLPGVIRAPNQFEPVNSAEGQQRMAALQPGSAQYANIGKTVDEAYGGNDPTNGAVNFIAPKAQVALGREMPAWAKGPGQDIGDHRFFGAPQQAQGDPAALPPTATPAQGFAIPGQPQGQPQGSRVAPGAPPDVVARAKAMWTSGDPALKQAAVALMQPYLGAKDQVEPMSPDERVKWKVPDGVSAGIERTTGKPVFSQPANSVNVNTVANPVLEGVGKQIVEQRKSAYAAVNNIPMLHEARAALDQGAITGQAADIRLTMAKVGNLFGLTNEQVANTEVFKTAIGNQVLGHIKELGANPSNADRDYIEKVQGGQIQLDEKSLRRIIDINEKYSRQAIKNFNRDAESLMGADPRAYQAIAPLMKMQEPPEYKAPAPRAVQPGPQGATSVDDLLKKYGPK